MVDKIEHIIVNSYQIIDRLPKKISASAFVNTLDVKALYPSIPFDYAMSALEFWFEKLAFVPPPPFTKGFVIGATRFILNNSLFVFEGKTYKQLSGIAMGSNLSASVANLTMAYLEDNFFNGLNMNIITVNAIKRSWFRYLDDVICIWENTWGDFSKFVDLLNQFHPNFNFTFSHN
jgi:hypothetical protein